MRIANRESQTCRPTGLHQMEDRGFDLETRLSDEASIHGMRSLAPTDRIDARSYRAEPPNGGLPVLEADEHLIFGSQNYLGLTADQRVQNAARQAAASVGTGAGGSRLTTGDTIVHHDLERLLAETLGTDRALTFPSGYATNVGTIRALEPDVVFVDAYTHVSSLEGCQLSGTEVVPYDHCDPDDLRAAMDRYTGTERETVTGDGGESVDESWLVVTDSTFMLDGAVAPLHAICDVAESVGAWVMVDETHATGLYARGGGIVQAEGVADRVHVQMGSLSSALASQGGYIAGTDALIEWVLNRAPPFVESTGLTPMAAAAASEALHLSKHGDQREQLWENVSHLREGVAGMGYDVRGDSQILAVECGTVETARELTDALTARGVIVQPPMTPLQTDLTDCTVPMDTTVTILPSAAHTRGQVLACLEAFQDAGDACDLL